MVKIYSLAGEILADVPITNDAIIREELMTSDEVLLSWNSDSCEEFPAGAYIEIDNERYSLHEPYRPTWINEAFYKYTPTFYSRVMYWQRMPIPIYTYEADGRTIKSREFDWEFIGTPSDAIFVATQAILNETGEEWGYEVAEGLKENVSIKAQNATIFSVLSDIAEQCETEWWVDKANNILHLSRCERYAELPLEVGVHVAAPNVTNNREGYYTRFYALGSTKNIVQDTGNGAIAQIVNKRLTLDPIKYPHGYKDIKGHFENGVFVSDLAQGEIFPTTLVFEDVFPSSRLKISSARRRLKYRLDENNEKIKIGEDSSNNPIYEQYAIWYFRLDDFVFTEDLIIEGKTLSVNFKTGKLAGRDFELCYHDTEKTFNAEDDVEEFAVTAGDYEIIIDESEGMILPSVDYIIPEERNEVVLFNINMPSEYTQSAQIELEEELDKEIEERLKDANNYEFESYPVAFRDYALSVEVGRRVAFKHNGEVLRSRVLRVEKKLDCEYQQKILIGNQKISGTRKEMRDEIRNVSEEVGVMDKTQRVSLSLQRNYAQSLRNTVANYLSLKDTIELLQGAFKGFSEGVNPVSVETMLLMLGDTSLQFRIFRDIESLMPLDNPFVYDANTKYFHVAKSCIVHYTLGPNEIVPSSSRDVSSYPKWDMDEFTSGELIEPEARYYLYARVSKTKQEGYYELVPKSLDLDGGEQYNLLVGILNAEYSGTRVFVPLYGYTAIMGGQINTDVIKSSDGQTYFDLMRGEIGGRIVFKSNRGGEKSIADLEDEIQDQIDGVVENWNGEGTPTLTNEPAVNWLTDAEKIAHINDTYINIEEYVDDETTPTAGQAWRWCRCTNESITDFVTVTAKDGETFNLHWHPIADSDAVRALKELATKADKSDLEVLTKNLKDGSTIVDGGLVMTSLVAVRNNEEEIEAFLNGSDFAEDTENGKLILAAGIPEGDADKLEQRSKEAATRIYENGRLETKEGKIAAFEIKEQELIATSISSMTKITPYRIELLNEETNLGNHIILTRESSPSEIIPSLKINKTKIFTKSDYMDEVVAAEIKCNSEVGAQNSKEATALVLASPNNAIKAECGQFAGLRPRHRRVTSSSVLTALDHTIECVRTDGGSITLTLPSNPEKGQCYEIWKWGNCAISINGNGKDIIRVQVSELASQYVGTEWVGIIKLVYRGNETNVNNWLMTLHRTE